MTPGAYTGRRARRPGRLLQKEFEKGTAKKAVVILENYDDDDEFFEKAVDTAASLAVRFLKLGFEVGLKTLTQELPCSSGTGSSGKDTLRARRHRAGKDQGTGLSGSPFQRGGQGDSGFMKFSSYMTIITWIAATVGFGALCLVEETGSAFLASAGAITFASLAINSKAQFHISKTLLNAAASLILAFFALDYLYMSESIVGAASKLLSVIVILKIYDLNTGKDYALLYALVFFELLAAAASTVSPLFFLALALFVSSAIWAMAILTVKKTLKKKKAAARKSLLPDSVFGKGFFVATLIVSTLSVAITLALFLVIPRMSAGLFQTKTLNTIKVSGFSDIVDLGSIGPVKLDDTIVMRIRVTGRMPGATLPA